MHPFKLKAFREDIDNISITTNSGFYIASISRDEIISFNSEDSFNLDEVKKIIVLQENFYTIFNALIERDEEIEKLKAQLKLFDNPINSRQ